ncbi:hypothetical protein CVS40_12134 [Lucilia cuprina]|nr:hypothetical protein CVS40_12134 [Lucilia cuprina]
MRNNEHLRLSIETSLYGNCTIMEFKIKNHI